MLIEDLDDELVVYDQEHDRAHSLNRTATLVWRNCDGNRNVTELAAVLRREGISIADDELVQLTVDYLLRAGLIEGGAPRPASETRLARRQLLDRIGVVGVGSLVLPVIETLTAPQAVAAASTGSGPCSGTCSTSN
jgi:hypothetical protein